MNCSVRYNHLMFGVLICFVWLNPVNVAYATTVTATATRELSPAETGFADSTHTGLGEISPKQSITPQNVVERELIFDLAADSNFPSFVRGSRPLKSALLILTVEPERFQISQDFLCFRINTFFQL